MDNKQAKLILSVYRPNGQDAADAFFEEALKQAQADPALEAWFTEQQRFDQRVAQALAGVRPPQDGKGVVEAGVRASQRRRRFVWPLMMAASLALLIGTGFGVLQQWRAATRELATHTELAVDLSEHQASLGLMSPDYTRLRKWVANRGAPLPDALPPGLVGLEMLGCQVWDTTRGKVSLLCFVGEDRRMVHLYVFDQPVKDGALPTMEQPRYVREGEWSLALWQEPGRAYVLAEPADPERPPATERFFRT